jgi:YD repeat-containing protein
MNCERKENTAKKMNNWLKLTACIVLVLHTTMASAEALSSEKMNVDLFHGQACVSIPIYNFESKHLSLPIVLSYRQIDLLNEDHDYHRGWEAFGSSSYCNAGEIPTPYEYNPGSVGLGWQLNVGGVITRRVNDIPDERDANPIKGTSRGNFSVLENDFTEFSNRPVRGSNIEIGEDEFTFNFCGHSGTFLYYRGKWKMYSDENIVIAESEVGIDGASGEKYISKLTLVTPDGVRYIFGGVNEAIEFTTPVVEGLTSEPKMSTAWYLTQIVSPEGDQINLTYTNNGYDNISPVTRQCVYSSLMRCYNSVSGDWEPDISGIKTVDKFPSDDQITNLSVYSLTNTVLLTGISSTTNPVTIQFNHSNYNAMNYPGKTQVKDKLDNIYIFGGQSCIKYTFQNTASTTQALRLDSLKQSGSAGAVSASLPAYRFQYNPVDHQIAPQELSKITYPTGGYTSIQYETSYLDGRPRVSKITSKSSDTDKSFITNYFYCYGDPTVNLNYESGVKAEVTPATIDLTVGLKMDDSTPSYYIDGHKRLFDVKKQTGYYCPSPDDLLWAFMGKPSIGYSSVWETYSQEGDNGTIVPMKRVNYIFNNYITESGKRNNIGKVGKPESITEYNMNMGVIKNHGYEYTEAPDTAINRLFIKAFKFMYNEHVYNYTDTLDYATSDPRYVLSKESVQDDDGSVYTTNYTYNFTTNRLDEKSVIESKTNYADDRLLPTTTTTSYRYLNEYNMVMSSGDTYLSSEFELPYSPINTPVETIVKKDDKIISGSFAKFRIFQNAGYAYYRPIEVYSLATAAPLSSFTASTPDWNMDSHYKLKTSFTYNSDGNVLESYSVSGALHVSYLYDSYQQPIMEFDNCTQAEITNTGATTPSKFRKSLPNALISDYTYDPVCGITSKTTPNGVTTYWQYDVLGRLKFIKNSAGKILQSKEYNSNVQ